MQDEHFHIHVDGKYYCKWKAHQKISSIQKIQFGAQLNDNNYELSQISFHNVIYCGNDVLSRNWSINTHSTFVKSFKSSVYYLFLSLHHLSLHNKIPKFPKFVIYEIVKRIDFFPVDNKE